jgi:G3E family GTPase
MQTTSPIPLTLLTGFLGAGKTTLINKLLRGAHGRRIAVLVNEFGEIGVDGALIVGAAGSVVELANGCICCATRGDLARALHDVLESGKDLDGILVETSGLADPTPVIDDLESYRFACDTRLDSVVTVVDAENFDRNLDYAEAAYQQIICADMLLISKADLVAVHVPALIENGLRTLNPRAPVLTCVGGEIPLELVFSSDEALRRSPRIPGDRSDHSTHDHGLHDRGFESLVLKSDRPFDQNRFVTWLDALPKSAYRVKGFVRFSNASSVCVVHAVGGRHSIDNAPPDVATDGAMLVVIGRKLIDQELQAGFARCAA